MKKDWIISLTFWWIAIVFLIILFRPLFTILFGVEYNISILSGEQKLDFLLLFVGLIILNIKLNKLLAKKN